MCSLHAQAKFTALRWNATPVDSVKKKKKSYPMFKIKPHSRNTMKYRVIAFKSNDLSRANEQPKSVPGNALDLSVNTPFKINLQDSSGWVITFYSTQQVFGIHKPVVFIVLYLSLYNLAALSQVPAQRPSPKAEFFSALPLQSLNDFTVSSSRFRSKFFLSSLKLNML